MRTLRTALTAVALCLLCVGYAASQLSYFMGNFVDYAARVDSPPVQRLAALLLLSAVILTFIREKEDPERIADQNSNAGGPGQDNAALPEDPGRGVRHDLVDLRFTTYDLRVEPQ